MALDIEPSEYIGVLLTVRPIYGWGWWRADDRSVRPDYSAIAKAGDLGLRVAALFWFHRQLRGLVGRVEQPHHQFNSYWSVCAEMESGDHDLGDRLCLRWDLAIGPGLPRGDWPEITSGVPIVQGYGIVAESGKHIDVFYESRGWRIHDAT